MSTPEPSIYWHDYETTGADPQRDRPIQFAGIRTDHELNIIGEPLVIYCKLSDEILPHPQACLITGITPQLAQEKGLIEIEFIKRIHQEFSQAKTCVAGYNNIRFDDEVTRNVLYRNFYDPYKREYQNNNSRWDIIDLVRMTHALRPDGINWPSKEDGSPSFRLEELSQANGISHDSAHDALSDVIATIELAKLIRKTQPRLYQFLFNLRDKKKAADLVNIAKQQAVIHVSSKYPASDNCIAQVLPIARDPINSNGIVVFNLSRDPSTLLEEDPATIRKNLFTPSSELPEGAQRVAIKTVHINKCPALAPAATMRAEDASRLNINVDLCQKHLAILNKHAAELQNKIDLIFEKPDFPPHTDPDMMIYSGGFFSRSDRNLMDSIINLDAEALSNAQENLNFDDKRLAEMLFRLRARNYPLSLDDEEQKQWQQFRLDQFENKNASASLALKDFDHLLQEMLDDPEQDNNNLAILKDLKEYRDKLIPKT